VAEQHDEFPNNFVGDLVSTERGWTVVPPTCCPDGHDYGDGGWSVSSVGCTCNGRHMAWRCHCGAALYAPQRDHTAESAIEAPYRCGRTSKSAHQAPERPPGEVCVVASANVHVTAWTPK
jgi:hypothetical protein